MNDDYEAYIPDALEMVSAWELPEEDFARVVNDQARLMAGLDLEPAVAPTDYPACAALRF